MRPRSLRLIVLPAAIAFVLASGVQVARASCGDYLMPHPAIPAGPSSAQEKAPPAMPQPCHGPNCSSREQLPVLPVAPAAVERDRPAALTVLIELPSPQHRDYAIETSITFSSAVLSDIFHPPR